MSYYFNCLESTVMGGSDSNEAINDLPAVITVTTTETSLDDPNEPTSTSQVEILDGDGDGGLALDLMDDDDGDNSEDSRYADAIILPRNYIFYITQIFCHVIKPLRSKSLSETKLILSPVNQIF